MPGRSRIELPWIVDLGSDNLIRLKYSPEGLSLILSEDTVWAVHMGRNREALVLVDQACDLEERLACAIGGGIWGIWLEARCT